jgi:hypothetical protein
MTITTLDILPTLIIQLLVLIDQAAEFSKWRTDRVNEAILEKKGYLKKNAKTNDVSAESSLY